MLPASCRQLQAGSLRSPELPSRAFTISLRTFFEGSGFAAQMSERFTGKMQ